MKQKLRLSLIALFTCLLGATAANDSDSLFKKYQNGRGTEIVYAQMDVKKELRKAKAGQSSEDVDVKDLEDAMKLGFHEAKILVCLCLGNVVSSDSMSKALNTESMNEFMEDFAQLRSEMLEDKKLSHFSVNLKGCNVDCFLPVTKSSSVKEGYLFMKVMNGSLNCLVHFKGKIKTKDVIESIENGTFIGINGFEPTITVDKKE